MGSLNERLPNGFTYGNEDAYQALLKAAAQQQQNGFHYDNEYAYQKLLRQALQPAVFRYNPEADPAAVSYAKLYRREGDRATANALAKTAAATGGVPSSHAVGAAQQAGAYYASQLSDKMAQMEQQAYNRYLQERALTMQGLNALRTDRSDAYNRYLQGQAQTMQGLNAMRTDRNDAYGMYLDELQKQQEAGTGIVTQMEGELQGNGGGSSEYTTTNPERNGMVEVGGKLMTWTELNQKVASGEIEEIVDNVNKTYTYRVKQ